MEDKESVQISKYISVEDAGKVQNFHFIVCLLHIGMFKKNFIYFIEKCSW